MLWPFILPIKITFWALVALVVGATATAPIFKWKHKKTFLLATSFACVAFIPSCSGIMTLLDAQRFGVFEYDTFDEVQDFRVERYLPPSATSITVQKHLQGFRARFSISEADLKDYVDGMWIQYGHRSTSNQEDAKPHPHDGYDDLGWPPLEDALEYGSPTSANGAGFTIWYSPGEGIAYEHAGYW